MSKTAATALLSHLTRRKFKTSIRRRYFGVKNLKFSGAVFAEDLPGHHFRVALLDEYGEEILRVTADTPTDRPGIPNGHGFSIPIPVDWLDPTMPRRVQFQIVETGELFPVVPREVPIARMLRKLNVKPALAPEESLVRAVGEEALVVGIHELTRTGAPLIILEIIKHLRSRYRREIVLLCLGEKGVLFEEFRRQCSLVVCGLDASFKVAPEQTKDFFALLSRKTRCRVALINSLVASRLAVACHEAGFIVKALIHEYSLSFSSESVARHFQVCSDIIFPCRDVHESFCGAFLNPQDHRGPGVSVLPQGCYLLEKGPLDPEARRSFITNFRQSHKLAQSEKVVAFCGTIDSRKGFDWMVSLILRYAEISPNASHTRFLWIGAIGDHDLYFHSLHDLQQKGLRDCFLHLEEQRDVRPALDAADVFFLCSRIDPFPSVVLEAILVGKPVIGFDRGQGCRELLQETGFGRIVPYQSLDDSVLAIDEVLSDPVMRRHVATTGPNFVEKTFRFRDYVDALHGWLFENHAIPIGPRYSMTSVSCVDPA